MTIIWKAKTSEGFIIKILAEIILHNNIKTACFEIDENGIKLCMMDSLKHKLINFFLQRERFIVYKCKTEKMFIGLNINYFHKLLKSIKKKDSIVLFIDDERESDLGIKVIPEKGGCITTSYIKIQNIQNLETSLPTGYNKFITIQSTEYQKACKELNNVSDTVIFFQKSSEIKFICDAGNVFSREVQFKKNDNEDDADSEDEEYSENFNTINFYTIMKIAGLSNNIKTYVKKGLPIMFKTFAGNLGEISIYIKTKKQIEEEEKAMFNSKNSEESEESEED